MALKDEILAKKLAKPWRPARPGPTISEDGSVHYRVFDEPIAVPISKNLETPSEVSIASVPAPVLQTLETQVVLAASKTSNPQESVALIPPGTKQEKGGFLHSNSIPLVSKAGTPDALATELMISGIALDILKYLLMRIHDDVTGITSPIMFNAEGLSFAGTASIKKTIQRLEKKGIVERIKFKRGKGGWTQYRICDHMRLKTLLNETDSESTETN